MMAWLAGAALAGAVSGAGVTLQWAVVEGVLHGEAQATTQGWVGVGFHSRPGLDGSVLLLGAAHANGTSEVVEHIAQPPNHPDRVALGGTAGLLWSEVVERRGVTTLRFRWRLATGDAFDPGLTLGAPCYITLAWSRSNDFSHHSAQRTEVSATLE